jgi:hypothetical protein
MYMVSSVDFTLLLGWGQAGKEDQQKMGDWLNSNGVLIFRTTKISWLFECYLIFSVGIN